MDFDLPEKLVAYLAELDAFIEAEIMPLGNVTGMTRAERDTLGRWIAQGTPP